ncbi:MAG: ABC transporter ATP-binding protein [Candidatus Micrarchaeota archaeon]
MKCGAEMGAAVALELRDIVKEYGRGKNLFRALDGVSLKIHKGEFVSIMGPSGSGKSTMLHFLGFLDTPTSGDAYIHGTPMSGLSKDGLADIRNELIGFVFQSFNLAPTLNVSKNIELPLIIGEKDAAQRREKVEELLKSVGLSSKRDSLPSQLSGGERQRAAIARSLAMEPEIILADEPTGNLDSASGKHVMDVLHGLWKEKGKTVVIVTHEPVVAAYARRTIHIRDGRIEKDTEGAGRKAEADELKIKRM